MSTFVHDVFISYNRKDRSFVEFLVRTLEKAGLRCFRDVTGLKVFDKLDASLKASIATSRWLVAVVSPNYLQSYWCMFEALEAIQGQDFEQRFLPIMVRYLPEDQSLDEDFVLQALQDLDGQMNEFESKLIKLKAYELAPKLDKLRFVRSHLPRIFQQIHERIFPEFALWDDASVRDTLQQIIDRLAPDARFDAATVDLDFKRLEAMPTVIPRLRPLPVVLWKARVGRQAWKNTPLVVGNDVLVGSAGARWNEADEEDGIYCLNAETGELRWFAPTPADANRLMVSKGLVLTGCDDGTVLAVSASDGKPRWRVQLDSGVVGGPFKLPANIGSSMAVASEGDARRDPVLVVTYLGSLYLLDLNTGREIQQVPVGGRVVGAPAVWREGYREHVAVPTLEGSVAFFDYSDIHVQLTARGGVLLEYPDEFNTTGTSVALLATEPVPAGGVVLQPLVRQTSYDWPPLVALDARTGEVLWIAADPEGRVGSFGNLRGRPTVLGEEVIFTTAYSRELCAVSLEDGRLLWSVDVGQGMFEQWSAPVTSGTSVYLGRHDGYLHKVDTATRNREWSLYLGASEHVGVTLSGEQTLPEFDATYAWSSGNSAPILATPVVDRGRLYIGTHEGFLYAIGNLGAAQP